MWGPGAIIHIINILPFAGILGYTLNFKRYNWLGSNPWGNRRQYNRRWWVRAFFGRFNYTIIGGGALCYLILAYRQNTTKENLLYSFTSYLEEEHRYDEEESASAHKQLVANLYRKRFLHTKDLVLKHRAERDRELKIAAFNELAGKYENL
jgi:hypothetical protein